MFYTDQWYQGEGARNHVLRGRNHQIHQGWKGWIQRGEMLCWVCALALATWRCSVWTDKLHRVFLWLWEQQKEEELRDTSTQLQEAEKHKEQVNKDMGNVRQDIDTQKVTPPLSPLPTLFPCNLFLHLKFPLMAILFVTGCLWWPCRCKSAGCRTTWPWGGERRSWRRWWRDEMPCWRRWGTWMSFSCASKSTV